MKKILMSIGSITAIATPIFATISCVKTVGQKPKNHKDSGKGTAGVDEDQAGGKDDEHDDSESQESSNKNIAIMNLKPGANWYGNVVEKKWGYFEVINSIDKIGQEPDEVELESLFDFAGDADIKLDDSSGTYEEQMKENGYAKYIVTDRLSDGRVKEKIFWFYCVKEEKIKLKDDATWYGDEVQHSMWGLWEYYYVYNSKEKLGQEPDVKDIEALFSFVWKGTVQLDASKGTFAEQMKEDGYASYKVKSIMPFGRTQEEEFRLYKSNE